MKRYPSGYLTLANASTNLNSNSDPTILATATASLSGAVLGDWPTKEYPHVTVDVTYTRGGSGAATQINMQVDEAPTAAPPWHAKQEIGAEGLSLDQTWARLVTATASWTWNFDTAAQYLRFRFWASGGNSDDKISATVTFSD
jgi:hypothetical protein